MTPPETQTHEAASAATSAVMLALVQTIQADITDMQQTLKTHIETEPKEWARVLTELMTSAFPEGDPDGHKRFHEASIKKAEDSAAFWHDMRKSVAKWGIVGFAIWVIKTLVEAGALWIQHGGHIK